jgi:hypothetical protein
VLQHTLDHAQRLLPGRTLELKVSMAQSGRPLVPEMLVRLNQRLCSHNHARLMKSEGQTRKLMLLSMKSSDKFFSEVNTPGMTCHVPSCCGRPWLSPAVAVNESNRTSL